MDQHLMRRERGLLALTVEKKTAELLMYDVIGQDYLGDGVTAKGVVQQLSSMPAGVESVLVRINSPGGDVFDGIAIMNALLGLNRPVNVQIDGLCASIASVIAMAGDTITMAPTAQLMIHNPWTLAMGDAREIRKTADLLDKIKEDSMMPAYARSGQSTAKLRALLDAETWFSATDAKNAGFIDAVLDLPSKAAARARYDLSAYRNAPSKISEPVPRTEGAAKWTKMRAEQLRLLELEIEISLEIEKGKRLERSATARRERLRLDTAEANRRGSQR